MSSSSSSSRSILCRLRTAWKNLVSKKESPRESQERHDLYRIALAVTYSDLRKQAGASAGTSAGSSVSSPAPTFQSRKELERIYDEATEALDRKEIHAHSVPNLRREVQSLLRPQILSLLQVCQKSQLDIPSTTILDFHSDSSSSSDPSSSSVSKEEEEYVLTRESNVKKCKEVLYEEQHHTLDLLDKCHSDSYHSSHDDGHADGHADGENNKRKQQQQAIFLHKKLSAIETIASFYQWEHFYFSSSNDNRNHNHNNNNNNNSSNVNVDGADEFGYILNKNEHVNNQIRYYQMINLSRSALIRQQLGYSTIALKSTIQGHIINNGPNGFFNGGRGIFIDGKANAGSIVAFFPGEVWPKEHLLHANSVLPYFQNDLKYHLSLRYDDILLDCRRAPYTVLDDVHSNAFAVAHIANHPPHPQYQQKDDNGNVHISINKHDNGTSTCSDNEQLAQQTRQTQQIVTGPNCCTTAIDFLDNMKLKNSGLDTFVPNTYKKPPMMLGPQAVDRDSIMMHSMGLVSLRDVENEEIFYDYRLSSGRGGSESGEALPDWYYICSQEEVENRWHHEK